MACKIADFRRMQDDYAASWGVDRIPPLPGIVAAAKEEAMHRTTVATAAAALAVITGAAALIAAPAEQSRARTAGAARFSGPMSTAPARTLAIDCFGTAVGCGTLHDRRLTVGLWTDKPR
jgi:hypothetical protein